MDENMINSKLIEIEIQNQKLTRLNEEITELRDEVRESLEEVNKLQKEKNLTLNALRELLGDVK